MKKQVNAAKLAAFAGAAAVGGFIYLVAPGKIRKKQRSPFQNRNFAHRGLHKRDKSVPENSLAAFERAASYGYGIELDVQLSKDGQVVVFHDDTLNRVCGVDARVDSKTLAELQQLSLCDYCIESFNPFIVRWFKINAPEVVRGQLANPPKDYNGEVKPVTGFILGNVLLNFLARPQFIAYKIAPKPFPVKLCEALGAMKVCWTSHEWANEKGNDTVIFEFYKPKLKFNKR